MPKYDKKVLTLRAAGLIISTREHTILYTQNHTQRGTDNERAY